MRKKSELPLTAAVPVFGQAAYGLGRNSSYAAAKRGDFPTMQVGALLRVPLRPALEPLMSNASPEEWSEVVRRFCEAEDAERGTGESVAA